MGLNEPVIFYFVQSVHNIKCSSTNSNTYIALKRQWYTCLAKSKPDLSDVWPEWRTNYNAFIEAMYCLGWQDKHTVERIIENHPLEPGNIQFVPYDSKIRTRKRLNTKYIECFGTLAPLAWFIEHHPLCVIRDYHIVYGRIASGWSAEKAMSTPTSGRKKPKHCTYSPSTVVELDGVKTKISDIGNPNKIKTKDLVKRLNLGWTLDQAMNTPLNGVRPSRHPEHCHDI